jgi:hypothetical protein
MQPHPLDWEQRARFRDVQHPSPAREVHPSARQQWQPDDGLIYDTTDQVAARGLILD